MAVRSRSRARARGRRRRRRGSSRKKVWLLSLLCRHIGSEQRVSLSVRASGRQSGCQGVRNIPCSSRLGLPSPCSCCRTGRQWRGIPCLLAGAARRPEPHANLFPVYSNMSLSPGARKDYEFNWAAHCVKKASRGLHGRRGLAKLCHQCTALNRKDELDEGASCRASQSNVTVQLLGPRWRLARKRGCDHRVNNTRSQADSLFDVSDEVRHAPHLVTVRTCNSKWIVLLQAETRRSGR